MRIEIALVTPALAAKWLEKNLPGNRPFQQSTADKYARQMMRGEWKVTHQGIAFNTQGFLIDGQHRLRAIVQTDISAKMVVARGVSKDAFALTDLGRARSANDVFRIQGKSWISKDIAATARVMNCDGSSTELSLVRGPDEMGKLAELHQEALLFVYGCLDRRVAGITTAPVMAAAALAYYDTPVAQRKKLGDFLRLLCTGVSVGNPADATGVHFREWLRTHGTSRSDLDRLTVFMKAQRAICAYLGDEVLTKIYAPIESIYSLPEGLKIAA